MTTISMEEYELMKDSKYRMYVAAIDKALKNFDYTSEWADLISALGKLNKVLTSYQKFRVIPRRIKISKRLAQCMHPALPSGVHLKALETYDIIFRTIGTARLSQELFIYSSGLFPLLGHAAMNIRPALLSMYETHFVPLHERLRPALIGFLSGVLPGLESGSDHFERTNQLLENVCDGVGPKYFYTCIWHCVTNNSPVRLPAISYVLTHYKRKFVMEDQLYLMGHDIDLMVSGLCAAVQDTNILVQRSALDLLMVCFPMQNKQLLYADMVRLVTAALTTILRRDMSLNRRLYSWLLEKEGTIPIVHIEDEIDDDVNHVHSTIAYDLLNDAIRIILKNSSMEIQLDIKPYRLLTSLFDKPQIGPIILDNILYDVFRALYLSCLQQQKHKSLNNGGNNSNNYNYINGNTTSITTTTNNPSTVRCVSFNGDLTSLKNHDDVIVNKQFIVKNCQELIKNANLLFNTLHSFYIWSYIEKLYSESILNIKNYKTRDRWQVNDIGCGLPNILEICLLTDFLLDIIPIESLAENTSNILPNLFNKIIIIMKLNMDILNHLEIEKSLELCTKILTKIQPLTLATTTTTAATTSTTTQIIKDETEIDSTTPPTTTTANNSDDKSVSISLSNDNDNDNNHNNNVDNNGMKTSLEKSKSDSKLNENFGKNELTIDDNTRERSYSNQMLKKKDKSSPKIDKKSKNKKSKSSSKLYDLKKEENEIDETIIVESEITTKTTTNIHTTTTTTRTATGGNKAKTENNKFFLKCLEEYKDFYIVFIKIKILPNVNIKRFLSTLIIDKNERTNSLYKTLEESLLKQDNFVPIDYRKVLMKTNNKTSVDDGTTTSSSDDDHDDNHVNKYESAMRVASNILLEFSAFPNIISKDNNYYYCGNNDKKNKLPKWLQSLLVAVCCKESTRDIQIIAMNTLLEIFSLSKNQKFLKNDDNVDDGTNIFITGILENVYVNFIEENTIVLEQMSQILWNTLRIASTQKQLLQCVTLLYQIHNIFDNRIVVEEVIGKYLVGANITVEYMKEFFLLWHLGRDLNIKLPSNRTSIRSFDRSLLKILDNLQNPDEPDLQLLSETFLSHSILHNDISRIINPILIKLLTPNTARVSIRHININDNDIQNEINSNENRNKIDENQSKKIYAISNENGNIMYHLTNNTTDLIKQQQSTTLLSSSTSINNSSNNNTGGSNGSGGSSNSKRKWFTFSKTGKKYSPTMVNVTTSIDDFNNIVTRKNRNDYKNYKIPITPPINHRIINNNDNKNNVKVIINPLSSKEIYSDGLDGSYSKIDSQPSSTDSLNSSICGVIDKNITNNDRDSGYESSILMKSKLLESIEPISDGVKDDQQTVNNNCNNNKIPKSHSFDEKCVNQKINDLENSSLVHSWSYCISDSDNLNAELEISTSAEEFFKKSDNIIINDIINEILDKVCNAIDDNDDENDKNITINNDSINNKRPVDLDLKTKSKNFVLYPIHSHICLYYEIFDSEQILYAIETLKNCLNTNPKLFIKCLATSGIKDLKNNDILYLLAKHRKSLLGYSFIGELNHEYVNFYRGYMFLDIIILICLNYSRTFYPPYLDDLIINKYNDINNNHKIQLECLELLNLIIKNLIEMVKENTKGFSIYIADMLVKCKLQKIILHCLLTSVRNFDDDDMTFAEQVLLFNNFQLCDRNMKVGEYVEAYQIRILRLVHSLIILEYYVYPQTKSLNNSNQESNNTTTKNVDLNYTPTILIPQQNIFLSAVMSALRHENMKNLHNNWLNMITSCLPYFGENIKQITISCIHQICNIIENISIKYNYDELDDNELCTDYAVTLLESLTILCHYCLLDPSQTVNQINIPILNAATAQSSTTPTTNPGEIFNNLVSAFFSPDLLSTTSTTTTTTSSSSTSASAAATTTQTITTVLMKQNNEHYQNARKTILSHMPRIISSVAKLWQTIVTLENDNNSIYGNTKIVKQQLLEFLSPISVHHGNSFLAAIAVAWYERRNLFTNIKTVLPEPNAGQNNLVYLISAIRVIPLDNLVQTVTAVIKNPPPIDGLNADICLDVSILELFYCYMRNASATQLSEAWSSLLALIREGSALSPPAQFLLAALLHELMIKCCPLEERKDQKDLQDVTAKLIESVSQVCGSCLEQTTWLRRNLAVKELDETLTNDTNNLIGTNSEIIGNSYSVQAQLVLAEILAPILDICFGSSEKDKVITVLTSLMYNIVPYLKTHTTKNMSSFLACSKLLASLSSYQYTRKAWKKDVFDLLLDNSLFQMDYNCLKYWRIIVDNLMTHDNTTFRDLMSRVSLTQSGSLSLFSSREQEYELRAQLLKRLAYVIFCSEMDQYAKYMPDIQEQLTASLRLNVPGVQAQVFLCFRVILIRMSPIQVTSLWPIIISEMLQVFLQIEQELSTDTEEFSSHIKLLSTLDASWSTNSNNGLHALGHPHWLKLQLSTAKLLDLVLLLPAISLPQFQMYRWAFVGDDLERLDSLEGVPFIPHVVRIAELMDRKFTDTQIETLPMKRNELLLTMNHIDQLKDLHSFFKTLSLCSNKHRTEYCKSGHVDYTTTFGDRQSDKKLNAILEKIDKVIEMDFLDKISR